MTPTQLLQEETIDFSSKIKELTSVMREVFEPGDVTRLKNTLRSGEQAGAFKNDSLGFHPLTRALDTAVVLCDKVAPDRPMVISILLRFLVHIFPPSAL